MKKPKVWFESKWHWLFKKRTADIFQPISVRYFSTEEQIAFLKQARELLLNEPHAEIVLRQRDCDMLLNIEANLLQK